MAPSCHKKEMMENSIISFERTDQTNPMGDYKFVQTEGDFYSIDATRNDSSKRLKSLHLRGNIAECIKHLHGISEWELSGKALHRIDLLTILELSPNYDYVKDPLFLHLISISLELTIMTTSRCEVKFICQHQLHCPRLETITLWTDTPMIDCHPRICNFIQANKTITKIMLGDQSYVPDTMLRSIIMEQSFDRNEKRKRAQMQAIYCFLWCLSSDESTTNGLLFLPLELKLMIVDRLLLMRLAWLI